jgi:hypothetical protein
MSAAGVCDRPTAPTVDQHWRGRWQSSVVPAWFALWVLPKYRRYTGRHMKISVDYENEIINRARSAAHVPTLETK